METLNVTYNNISSVEGLNQALYENPNSTGLKIIECPSTRAVINLMSQDWFKNNLNDEIISLNFAIDGNIEEEDLNMPFFQYTHKLMITLASMTDNKFITHFKIQGDNEKFNKIDLSAHSDEVRKFVVGHVCSSLASNFNGLLTNIGQGANHKINSFGDQNGFNLLMMATTQNRVDIVRELISLKCFDVNHKVGNVSAIDLAWNEGFYDILLDLLNANSLFPINFDIQLRTTDELQNFIDTTSRLHNLIRTHSFRRNNSLQISQILDQNLNLRHFFDFQNQSAAFVALENKKFDIYELLGLKNVVIAQSDSSEEIQEILEDLSEQNEIRIKNIHQKCARDLPNKHILRLLTNSFVGLDDLKSEERFSLVWDAYEALDKIKKIQPILELISHAGKFKIFFDFHRDSVQFLDPYLGDEGTNGLFYQNGLIYVAAKSLFNIDTRNKTLGVLVHELCHFAMVLVYRNEARPYAVGDLNLQQVFENISNICELRQNLEEIIGWVYEHYVRNIWHQELIVRIPHILGHYFNDSTKIQELLTSDEAPFRDLYNYYNDLVLPHIKSTISVLNKITNEPNSLTFNSLSPQLQSKVKNSEVLFQGQKLSLLKIVEENSKAFCELSCDQLIKLINSEEIEISKIVKDNVEVYVERKLSLKSSNETKTFNDLTNNLTPLVLLSDFAGAGKTTALIKIAHKIKKDFTSKWIQFIDLKSHFDAFKECIERKFETQIELSIFLSSKVLKLDEKKLEKEIFVELFAAGKIVFLFDGVDEISPSFNEFARNLFRRINQLSNNIQWISTRPECVDELEKVLKVEAFEFCPLTKEEVNKILRMIFIHQNLSEIESRLKIANEIIEKLSKPMSKWIYNQNREVENPLLINMIADESLDHDFTKSLNIFTLFENFFNRKQQIVYKKGDEVQKDCIKASSQRMTISQVHQHYALKLLYRFESLASLNILTKKVPWTADQINRYGILYLHADGSFLFLHRNFAEFFASQYIIENIYDCEESPRENEAENRVKLLFYSFDFNKVVLHFFENHLDLENKSNFDKTIQDLIASEFKLKFKHNVKLSIEILSFILKLFDYYESYNSIRSLWLWDDENILLVALRNDKDSYENVLSLAQYYLYEEDLNELMDIKNERGNFLYYMLRLEEKRLIDDKSILRMDDEQIDELVNLESFFEFTKRIKIILGDLDIKNLFLKNSPEIMKELGNLEDIWILDELEKNLSEKELKLFLIKKDNNCESILSRLVSSTNEINENFLIRLFELLKHTLLSEDIKSLLTDSEIMPRLAKNFNKNIFKLFLNFIKEYKEIQHNLSQGDYRGITPLLKSVDNHKDPEMFKFLERIYDENISLEEQKEIILKCSKLNPLFDDIICDSTPISNVSDLVKYIKKIFRNDKKALGNLINVISENCEKFDEKIVPIIQLAINEFRDVLQGNQIN